MYLEWISWEAMRRFTWFVEYHCFFFLDWGGLRYMDGSGRYLDDI